MIQNFPKKIEHCPLIETVLEIRFTSTLLDEAIFGVVYNSIQNEFSSFKPVPQPILQIPLEIRKSDPNIMYQPLYRLENKNLSIGISPKSIIFSNTKEYIGPGRYNIKLKNKPKSILEWSKTLNLKEIKKRKDNEKRKETLEEFKQRGDFIPKLSKFRLNRNKNYHLLKSHFISGNQKKGLNDLNTKYFSNNINYFSSMRENRDYRNKLIYNINDNKAQNSNMNKIPQNKNQYLTFESLNESGKDQEVKSYNSIRKSIINEEKSNDAILIPYNNNNNYIQYNYMNSTLNNTNKSKLNSYKYISPKNNTFDSNLKYNFNSLNDIYLNKSNSIKVNDNDGDEDNIEFSKSTNNFNKQYTFSSKNLNNNRSSNSITNNNNSSNILNYYIVRKNEFLNSNKEFNSSINQVESPRQQNYTKTQNSNEIASKQKQNLKTIYYDSINNSINRSKDKSTRNNLYHYYAYDFDNNKSNKIEEFKNYYDNLINDNEDNEKTMPQFNTKLNANSYTNLNREHLYNSIDRKENDYMNDVRIFKNKNYNNIIEDNKSKEISNNQNINGINFNNINIGINNNNFILDNNLNNGYKTYYGSFSSKPIKANVNTSINFKENNIIEVKDEDSLLKEISKNKKKYISKRNKSQNSKLILKTEEDQNDNLERSKSKSIYNKIKINKNLLYNNPKDEEKSNYGVLSYNFHKNKDELFNNYFMTKKFQNDKSNYNNMNNNNNIFLISTNEKKISDNFTKNEECFILNDSINNLNDGVDLKDDNDESYQNSLINNKTYNNNQLYESKYNRSISDRIMNKYNEIKNKNSYKDKLENIKIRVTNLLDIYQVLLNNKIIIIKNEM